jgi:BON domain/Pentapeptide repeats (8 copies)
MTSVSRQSSRLGISVLSATLLFSWTSAVRAQLPSNNSPSPFGSGGRLPNSGFQNVGFRNTGLQNVGFRNTGFQNVGFRNSAISNTGNLTSPGAQYIGFGYPFGGSPAGNGGSVAAPANNMANITYSPAPQQYGIPLDTSSPGSSNPYYAPDDTASISIGRGTNLTTGYSTPTISRGARYTMSLGFDSPVGTTNPRLSEELQRQFTNSQQFPSGKDISVAVENNVVVLRGKVSSEHERDLAEALVRLSPGVYNVRNELQIGGNVAATIR